MKKIIFLLLFALLFLKAISQKEYIYTNMDNGVEVKFPSKPEITYNETDFVVSLFKEYNALLSLKSAGLVYKVSINKGSGKVYVSAAESLEGFKKNFHPNISKEYVIGGKKITEFDMSSGGGCTRYKIIDIKKGYVELSVTSQTCAQDKDVLPFFNSLKIDGIEIRDPNTGPNQFKNFAIDYAPKTKTDTVRQIVYVNTGAKPTYQYERSSDVDKNIPKSVNSNPLRFALIIGNEDYSSHQVDMTSEINVDFARNDASAFKEYAIQTLGIPEKNVVFLLDATTGVMNQAFSKMNLIIKNTQGNADVFFYYAGHGLPDEVTKEAFLIPVDVSGKNAGEGIKLQNTYSKLTEYPSKRITVFIDACFSGGARNQGLLAARGIKIRAKEDPLNGNLVVFTASSGEQSSLAFKEKQHGIFTYFLLQKLQESKGSVSYNELSKYIHDNVSLQSVLINDKEQSPQVNVSNSIGSEWEKFDLK